MTVRHLGVCDANEAGRVGVITSDPGEQICDFTGRTIDAPEENDGWELLSRKPMDQRQYRTALGSKTPKFPTDLGHVDLCPSYLRQPLELNQEQRRKQKPERLGFI